MRTRICYFISLLICSFQGVGEARSQADDPSREDVKRLIVRIDSTFPDKSGFGAGIVVGIVNSDVYIATANHVVREGDKAAKEIKVQIRGYKESFAVRAAPQYSVELDLAILIIPQASSHGIDVSAFP
ncbi:MAG: serine protease, partial [Acidobacteriota bacterium]|nr:serine protease [Acidobacteriota bacterium]